MVGTLAGNGVLIYNTVGILAAGPIAINTRGWVNLSAASTGVYQGISIFQDRSVTQGLIITGNGSTTISGTVYAAGAAVNLTSTASSGWDTLGGAYICSSMQAGGSGSMKIDLGNNRPQVPQISLVE